VMRNASATQDRASVGKCVVLRNLTSAERHAPSSSKFLRAIVSSLFSVALRLPSHLPEHFLFEVGETNFSLRVAQLAIE
jgi:hypothetical protein